MNTNNPFSEQGSTLPPGMQVQVKIVRQPALVTYALLGVTVIAFLVQLFTREPSGIDLLSFWLMKVNPFIEAGQYWRLITPVLVHGSVVHLAFNMYALFIFGPGLEQHYGHLRFLLLYLLGALAGNVMSFLFSANPSLGSSTAIFGLLAAQAVFVFQNQKLLGPVARRALNNLLMIAVLNLVIGFSPGSNIDNLGHLGGILGGGFFAWLGGPILTVNGIYPDYQLEDQRTSGQVWSAALLVAIVFGGLAVYKLLF